MICVSRLLIDPVVHVQMCVCVDPKLGSTVWRVTDLTLMWWPKTSGQPIWSDSTKCLVWRKQRNLLICRNEQVSLIMVTFDRAIRFLVCDCCYVDVDAVCVMRRTHWKQCPMCNTLISGYDCNRMTTCTFDLAAVPRLVCWWWWWWWLLVSPVPSPPSPTNQIDHFTNGGNAMLAIGNGVHIDYQAKAKSFIHTFLYIEWKCINLQCHLGKTDRTNSRSFIWRTVVFILSCSVSVRLGSVQFGSARLDDRWFIHVQLPVTGWLDCTQFMQSTWIVW